MPRRRFNAILRVMNIWKVISKFLLPIALATIDSIAIPIKAVKKYQVGTGRYEQSLGEHGVLVSFYCNVFISSSVTQVEYSRARSYPGGCT